jgi:hypothetical protein
MYKQLPLSCNGMPNASMCEYSLSYEEDSVNRTHVDIKRKICDIRTRKKHLFLDIRSINTDTLVPSLCQCVETCSIEVL